MAGIQRNIHSFVVLPCYGSSQRYNEHSVLILLCADRISEFHTWFPTLPWHYGRCCSLAGVRMSNRFLKRGQVNTPFLSLFITVSIVAAAAICVIAMLGEGITTFGVTVDAENQQQLYSLQQSGTQMNDISNQTAQAFFGNSGHLLVLKLLVAIAFQSGRVVHNTQENQGYCVPQFVLPLMLRVSLYLQVHKPQTRLYQYRCFERRSYYLRWLRVIL